MPAGKAEPLRIGLATYVEPVHARQNVARSSRGGRGRSIARGGRSAVGVAQGRKSGVSVARTAPQRYRRGGKATVQTARSGNLSTREAKLDTRQRNAQRTKAQIGKPAKATPSAKSRKSATTKRRG